MTARNPRPTPTLARLFAVVVGFALLAGACASSTVSTDVAGVVQESNDEPAVSATTPAEPAEESEPVAAGETEPVAADVDENAASEPAAVEFAEEPEVDEVEESTFVDGAIPAADGELDGRIAYGGGNPEGTLGGLLNVTLPTVGGEPLDLGQQLGDDLVLWFWAPWCAWCNAEASRVSTIAAEFADDVQLLGVAGVSDPDSMQGFVDRHDLHHITHLADLSGDFWRSLDVTYQPWWIFINDDGQVLRNWQGRLSEDELREAMLELSEI